MAAQLLPQIKATFFDADGNPLTAGRVYTYVTGTDTLQATYSNIQGTVENENPVILDARGQANIYLGLGKKYKIVVKDSTEVVQMTVDPVYGEGFSGFGNGWYNVRNYGAAGDGVTNDTAAFQAAMAAASSAGGGIVYIPAGTYKVTSQLNNSGPRANCMGFVGDSATTSVIDMSTITTDGVVFNNPPVGLRFENFRLIGPGQTAPVSAKGLSLPVDGLGPLIISFQCLFTNVTCEQWPTAGFYWALPIVSTYTNCVAQECGAYGFQVDIFTAPYVGGTSTQFNACYANNVLGSGYKFKAHGYSLLSSCAADNCNIAYDIERCFGMSMSGCGCEVATYIDGARPGHAVVVKESSGITIDTLWTYNMPNVNSVQVNLITCDGVTVRGVSGYQDNGVAPTYNAIVDAGTNNTLFENNVRYTNDLGDVHPTFVVNDLGVGTMIIADQRITGIKFDTPDIYGNSLTVTNGAIALSAAVGAGAVNIFDEVYYDYPIISASNDGTITFGPGATAGDTVIQRAGVNLLNLPKIADSITVEGASNPQILLDNTGFTQQWAISADNGRGLAFYDATNASSPAYLYRDNVAEAENAGLLQLSNGLRIEGGGRLYIKDYGNSASGTGTLVAGTKVINNTLVTADSMIFLTAQTTGGTPGELYVSARTAGTSFTVSSTSATDTRTFAYIIVEP